MNVAFVLIHEDLDFIIPVGLWDHTDDSHQMSSAVSRPAACWATNWAAVCWSAGVASVSSHGGFCPGFAWPCVRRPRTVLPMLGASWDTRAFGNTRVSSYAAPADSPST